MIVVCHFVPVLLFCSVPCRKYVGRIGINQHIRKIKPFDQIHGRPVFNLDAAESLRCFDDVLGKAAPLSRCIRSFAALHVVFPADLFAGRAKSVAHHHPNVEIDRPLKAVRFRVLRREGPVVHVAGVWGEINLMRQSLRVFPDPLEQVDDVAVQIVDGLDGAAILAE